MVKSIYDIKTRVYTHTGEKLKVNWSKHCRLHRIAKKCCIYNFTSGACDSCGQNKKLF